MSRQDAIIFDLDGTLINPVVGITNAYQAVCDAMGLSMPTSDALRRLIGPPIQEAIGGHFQLEGDDLDEAVRHFRRYYGTLGIHEYEKFPSVDELLTQLHRSGFVLCIATSKPDVYANSIINEAGWDEYFSVVAGAELDGSRRYKSEIIAWVLGHLDPADRVLTVVGDRGEDVAGALANGLPCIGVTWGFGTDEQLSGASRLVSSMDELLAVISTLSQADLAGG